MTKELIMTKELSIKELVMEQDEGFISGGEDYIGKVVIEGAGAGISTETI